MVTMTSHRFFNIIKVSIEQTHLFERMLIDMISFPLISISFALGSGAWEVL